MLVSSGYAEHVCVHGELRASWRCLCVQQQPLTCDVTPCTVAMASTMRLQPAALLCISCDLCKGSAFIACGVMQNVWWLSSSRSLMRLLLACSHGSAFERDFRSATHSGGATCEEQRDTFEVPSASVQQACGVLRRLHAVTGWHDLHISCRALPHPCRLQVAGLTSSQLPHPCRLQVAGLIASQLPHPCRLQVLAARCADVPAPWLACQVQLCGLQA